MYELKLQLFVAISVLTKCTFFWRTIFFIWNHGCVKMGTFKRSDHESKSIPWVIVNRWKIVFTDVGFHLKSGFKKLLCSKTLVFTLTLDSRKYCVHQFFLYYESMSTPWIFVNYMSPCPYPKSLSIPRVQGYTLSLCSLINMNYRWTLGQGQTSIQQGLAAFPQQY